MVIFQFAMLIYQRVVTTCDYSDLLDEAEAEEPTKGSQEADAGAEQVSFSAFWRWPYSELAFHCHSYALVMTNIAMEAMAHRNR